MENYREQTVSANPGGHARLLYALSWAALALLLLLAVIFAAGIFGQDADGSLKIGWLSALLCALLLAGAALVWRFKDKLRVEYDYLLRDGVLEVTQVLNNRRRRPALRLELSRIQACGPHRTTKPGVKVEKFYLDLDAALTSICYEEKGERRMALLQLNEDMIAQLRGDKSLQRGAWRDGEGKN